MVHLKRPLVGAVGAAISIVLLQRMRNRRTDHRQEAEIAARETLNEASKATEHSVAAFEHARIAGENAVKVANEFGEIRDEFVDKRGNGASSSPIRRLRNAAKGRA